MTISSKRSLCSFVAAVSLTLALSAAALAGTITVTGSLWINQAGAAGDATLANVPTTAPDVTFSVVTSSNIEFSSYFGPGSCGITCGNPSDSYTVGSFLMTGMPAATNIVENTPGALSGALDNTIFLLSATVDITNGEVFAVGHDDGASFYIDGNAIPGISPGPTGYALTDITYTGPTESGAMLQMVYGECCGAPAVFATNLPTGGGTGLTPEPASVVLFGSGFLAVAALVRKRSRTAKGSRS
jgi:hypothetical protein